ncbi:MAG TPA: M20/M25/M40 family metallo-hydrolase [Chryseosolibacter sp.]|nr:M20/M25/M40 family metallo-hydrolase [Chryseosolibacter sp.]
MKTMLLLLGIFISAFSNAQNKVSTKIQPEKARSIIDTEIASMIAQISADSIRNYISKMVSFGTRHSLSDTTSAHHGIGAARRWVAGKFRQFARENNADMQVTLDAFAITPNPRHPRVPYPMTMKNVVATLRGTDPDDDRIILVSGHLDSRNSDVMDSVGRAPGANDDASGVAVVLELARLMSMKKYPCTIIFMAVQGEEQGLLGARHMAGKLKNDSANVVAMLNNDIVGNSVASETGATNDKTVRIFSEMIPSNETDAETAARNALKSENDSPSRQLARYIRETAQAYLRDFTVTLNARPDRFLRGGDHTPFSQLGFTAVRFTEFHENFTHQHQNVRKENNVQYGDLPEFVDYDYAADVARVNLIAIASLAKAAAAPEEVQMKISLGNVTHLTWRPPSTGPNPKGYYVLMRETYQPFWETKFFVSDTTVALPYSKDNYFFAVQSVGDDGHISLPVMPIPVRE